MTAVEIYMNNCYDLLRDKQKSQSQGLDVPPNVVEEEASLKLQQYNEILKDDGFHLELK